MILNIPQLSGFLSTNKLSVELKQRVDLMESGVPQVRIPEFRFEPVHVQKINGLFSIDNNTSTVRDYYSRVIDVTIGRMSFAGSIEVDKNIDFWRAVIAGAEIGILEDGKIKYYILHADDEFINPDASEIEINGENIDYSKHILSNGLATITNNTNGVYTTNENPYWTTDTTRGIEIFSEDMPLLRGYYSASVSSNLLQISGVVSTTNVVGKTIYWREVGSAWYPTRLRAGRLFAPTGLPVFDMRIIFNRDMPNEVSVICEGVVFISAKDSIDKGNVSMSLDFMAKRVYIKSVIN